MLVVGNVLPGESVARIGRPEYRDDLFVVDQVRHVLDRFRRLREIVTNDQRQLSAENAAGLVDVIDRGLKTESCRLSAESGRRGREIAVEAELDVLRLGRQNREAQGCGAHHRTNSTCCSHCALLLSFSFW